MKLFHCSCNTDAVLFFESVHCGACGRMAGFCPDRGMVATFEFSETDVSWISSAFPEERYRQCANYSDHQVCNWMVASADPQLLCRACRCNDVIPDLSVPENLSYWRKMEAAKRHALYTLLTFDLPFSSKYEASTHETGTDPGLLFRFMNDKDASSEFTQPLDGLSPIYTGHEQGEITVNLAEADAIARTRARIQFGEDYRTLLGHFRHELGHYYWSVLIESQPRLLTEFRKLFGDERQDYATALESYYANGPAENWQASYLSAYASMHPWEDWAESWAHFMHMIDTLETANAFELSLHSERLDSGLNATNSDRRYSSINAATLLRSWMRLGVAMNALNRSMGLEDAYPFVLTDNIRNKLSWICRVVANYQPAINTLGSNPMVSRASTGSG